MAFVEITLREPLWLWLALLPVLIFIIALLLRAQQPDRFNDKALSPWVILDTKTTRKGYWRYLFFSLLAWNLFALALAGPRLPDKIYELDKQAYSQLLIVVDTSFSMAARDVQPSRIERAKLELLDLVNMIDNTRVGIIVFSARPHVLVPPTFEKSQLRQAIQSLRSEWLPTAGSDVQAALEFTHNLLAHDGSANNTTQAVLLVSDGDVDLASSSGTDQNRTSVQATLAKYASADIAIYSFGIGTPVATPLLTNEGQWLKHNNLAVTTRLNKNTLEQISQATRGAYVTFSDSDQDWQSLYYENIRARRLVQQSQPDTSTSSDTKSGKKTSSRLINWTELFYIPLLAAVLCYVLAQVRITKAENKPVNQTLLQVFFIFLFVMPVLQDVKAEADANSSSAETQATYTRAFKLYNSGQYQAAKQIFTRLSGYAARMGEADAAYQLKQFPLAAALYIQANLDAINDAQRARAIFNLANSYYKMTEYQQAAQLYQDSLRYADNLHAAKINYEYAIIMAEKKRQRLLEERSTAERSESRPGSGPRSVNIEQNVDINSARITLSDKDETVDFFGNTTDSKQDANQTLLNRARPASQNIELQDDTPWTYTITDSNAISLQQRQITYDESIIWKRMFEQEEGFPAPVAAPKVIPEVKPW